MGKTTVVVMLSTWNGERYLAEQLESLAAQEGDFHLKLKIRDDGSTDGTIDLIKSFCRQTEGGSAGTGPEHEAVKNRMNNVSSRFSVSLVQGENLGFVRSFFELLCQSDMQPDDESDNQADSQADNQEDDRTEKQPDGQTQWYAFCDQDDVWQPDKLNRAIQMLRAEAGDAAEEPLLYSSRLQMVDGKRQPIGYTRITRRMPSFTNALVENIATGATLVMNRSARDLLAEGIARIAGTDVKDVLLHDWWCYLVISAFGKVLYDTESRILYRQHELNAVGQKNGFLARQKQRLHRFAKQGNVRGITRQAQLFSSMYAVCLPIRSQQVLQRFLDRDAHFFKRIAYAVHPDVKRQAWYDDLILRLLIFLGRI